MSWNLFLPMWRYDFFLLCVCMCVRSQVDAWLYKHVVVYLQKSPFIRMFVLLKDSCFAYSECIFFFFTYEKKDIFLPFSPSVRFCLYYLNGFSLFFWTSS